MRTGKASRQMQGKAGRRARAGLRALHGRQLLQQMMAPAVAAGLHWRRQAGLGHCAAPAQDSA